MARPSETVAVLNDYGFTRRSRVTSSGAVKNRYVTTIHSEPILVAVDPRALTRAPANAMADHLKQRIKGIGAPASAATLKSREVDERAFAAGKSWAMRRFSGGKTGSRPPNQSDRLFNNSGRFADSIAVGATKNGWTINVAANRLDPTTFGDGEAGILRMLERLRQYVPEFGDPKRMAEVLSVRRAIKESPFLRKANERTADLEIARMQAFLGAVGEVVGLAG